MEKKCSLCGKIKSENEFRFMKKQNRFNAYCKKCERWYNTLYMRQYRERKREETKNDGIYGNNAG